MKRMKKYRCKEYWAIRNALDVLLNLKAGYQRKRYMNKRYNIKEIHKELRQIYLNRFY